MGFMDLVYGGSGSVWIEKVKMELFLQIWSCWSSPKHVLISYHMRHFGGIEIYETRSISCALSWELQMICNQIIDRLHIITCMKR
jgi:hypothetical protein